MTDQLPRDFKGIWIPKELWQDNRLTIFEKCLAAEIDSLDHPARHCYAGNDHFSSLFQMSERTISQGIAKLKALGIIEIHDFDGRTRTLKSNLKTIYAIFYGSGVKPASSLNGSQLLVSPREDLREREIPVELPVELPKNKEPEKSASLPPPAASAILDKESKKNFKEEVKETTNYFFEKLRALYPKTKDPNMEKWCMEIDRLNRLDKKEFQEIKDMIDWCTSNSFWCTVILSTANLREQWQKMDAQKSPPPTIDGRVKKNRELAQEVKIALEKNGEGNNVRFFSDRIYSVEKQECVYFTLPESTFKEVIMKLFDLVETK